MPSLVINTNVSRGSIPENFLKELSALMASMLGKPESFVCVHVNPDQLMTWGGTAEPCALAYLGCIGKIGAEENRQYTTKLTQKITTDLKVPADRMYINFTDIERANCGWNNKTFAQ